MRTTVHIIGGFVKYPNFFAHGFDEMRVFFEYIKAIFADGSGIVFTIFDILGIIIFFSPSLNITLEDYLPQARLIGGTLLLLSFLLANLRVYKKLTRDNKSLRDKLSPRLQVVIERVSGYEEVYSNQPLDKWATKIRITNQGVEPAFFTGFSVDLVFRKPHHPSSFKWLLFVVFGEKLDMRPAFALSVPGYQDGIRIAGTPPEPIETIFQTTNVDSHPVREAKSVFLVNWETKQPIILVPHHERRGPMAGETELWAIYGKFDKELGEYLYRNGFYLTQIGVRFYTDRGEFYLASSTLPLRSVDPELVKHFDSTEKAINSQHPKLFKDLDLYPIQLITPRYEITAHRTAKLKDIRVVPPF